MTKVSKQTAAKGGLLTAILGMIGNVVGIGIFFKNGTVFRLNGQVSGTSQANCWGVLIAWIISTLIVLSMAISFAEIASCKTKTGKAGIGPWGETFCGHKFGRYTNLGYNLIFWPLNTFAVMFFAGEALLAIFSPLTQSGWNSFTVGGYNYGDGTVAYIFLIGLVLFVFFMLINYFRFKNMAKVGKAISFVKFAPIAMVIFIGIIFGAIKGGGLWTAAAQTSNVIDATSETLPVANLNLLGIIACIPAILFSFEGYVAIDSFKNDLSNPDKQVPLGVVLGVVVIAALYLAVTIGCITAGTGNVYQLMEKIKEDSVIAYKVLTMLISILIFICLIGCVNGMARGGITAYQELCKSKTIFMGDKLAKAKPGNDYFAGAISFSIMVAIWFIIIFVPSMILNTDAIADGSSTSMIICLYVIYGGIVLGGLVNRFTKRVQISTDKNFKNIILDTRITKACQLAEIKMKNKNTHYIRVVNNVEVKKTGVFPVAAVIGVIACLFMVGYVAFFQFTAAPIKNGLSALNSDFNEKAGWGMFVASDVPRHHTMTNLDIMVWFWVMTIIAAGSPLINDLLIKGFDKTNKNPLIWQKENQNLNLR